jgi:riboflavin synthase
MMRMFTGIVENTLKVAGVADGPKFRRLTLVAEWQDVHLGDSIAVNCVCLTVAELMPAGVGFDVVEETLAKTNLGLLKVGHEVNVERSLRAGDRIDGHFVQGHVDTTAPLLQQSGTAEGDFRLRIETPHQLAKYVVPKGSITVDGVSLTIAALADVWFEVALIPTTLNLTTLGRREPGWMFNLEADILSKTIVTWLERFHGQGEQSR